VAFAAQGKKMQRSCTIRLLIIFAAIRAQIKF